MYIGRKSIKEIQYGRSKPQERTYIIVGTHLLHDQIMYVISSVVGCANPQCHRPNCPVVKAMVNVNAVYNRIVKDIKVAKNIQQRNEQAGDAMPTLRTNEQSAQFTHTLPASCPSGTKTCRCRCIRIPSCCCRASLRDRLNSRLYNTYVFM